MRRMTNSWLSTIAKLGLPRKSFRRRASKYPRALVRLSRLSRFESLEERLALYSSTMLVENGPPEHRIDMVFVGDGFATADQSAYSDEVDFVADRLLNFFSPFDEYASYFNVQRVDVASNESGIDIPATSVFVDTALNGAIAPSGSFVVDQNLVVAAARNATNSWDLIQVVLNNEYATGNIGSANAGIGSGMSLVGIQKILKHGSTDWNPYIHAHEIGHSLGRLGDEYFPETGVIYNGSEPSFPNLTVDAMGGKWERWKTGDHPEIGAFEGGNVSRIGYQYGLFRPSENSIMRDTLEFGASFDAIGKESLIIEMYKLEGIRTIDTASPLGEYHYGHEFYVNPMQPTNHDLDIQWFVDDVAIVGATGQSFDTSSVSMVFGNTYTVRVEVTDNTDMVRDEGARTEFLTDSLEWTVNSILKVTTEDDENGTNPSALSLREALALAANNTLYPGSDTIEFDESVSTIAIGSQLTVGSNVVIAGPGADKLTVTRNSTAGRIFQVNSGVTATISGMTISGGSVTGAERGGGIVNGGDLTLDSVVVSNNSAADMGGGVSSTNKLKVVDSTFFENTANVGGAIQSLSTSSNALVIENSAFISNHANNHGGAIRTHGSSGLGSTTIVNTTFSDNTSGGYAGAVTMTSVAGPVTIVNSTLTDNHASGDGGGIHTGGGSITLHNTIVAGNTAANAHSDDIMGTIQAPGSHNLLGADESSQPGTGNVYTDSIGLAPLGEYGGPTKSHALLSTSPARDAGSNAQSKDAAGNFLTSDQRGYLRRFDDPSIGTASTTVDIGAFEYILPQVANVIVSSTVPNEYNTNPPYEFDDVVGTEEQLRTVPVGGANQISIQFNEDVEISEDDLELIVLNRIVPAASIVNFVAPDETNGNTATWSFSLALPAGQLLLRLADSIADLAGNSLDGEWTNPTYFNLDVFIATGPSQFSSAFPSGNFIAGGDFEFVITNMPGDVNRNQKTNSSDFLIMQNHWNGTSKTWVQGDVNGNGIVNTSDFLTMQNTFNLDWQSLRIVGDFDGDFDVDDSGTSNDEDAFWTLFNSQDEEADLVTNGVFNQADIDAFYEILGREIELEVVT